MIELSILHNTAVIGVGMKKIALYYIKSILTDFSASGKDKKVL